MKEVLDIITNETLTYNQQLLELARLAENFDHTIELDDNLVQAKEDNIICDLGEGNAPYRPRYIVPDYSILMKNGSEFLGLKAPKDLAEALNSLLIMYRHVPSITSFPVYLGNFDELLEPFVLKEDREFAKKLIGLFLLNIDRTLNDSFVHANIGPVDTLTGRIILELTEEMELAIPNLTLKYDPDLTSNEFAELAAKCMLKTAKPSFANNKMFKSEWGDYAIASCYNGLRIKGGGFTLPRLRLYEASLKAKDIADFKNNILPKYTDIMLKMMDDRIDFIVEESSFFKSNFLVTEGFVELDNFTGMFGVVGLAECVNNLLNISDNKLGYGNNKEADDLGEEIIKELYDLVDSHDSKYAKNFNHKYRLHAQVGIDSDGREDSPGCRIPIGAEPIMPEQIIHSERFHKYFPTGIGDIFKFEETWEKTPNALVDIIKGALTNGMRYFSAYLENTDVVRVTGYLVKKSELAKLDAGKQSLNNVSIFGKGARDFSDALDRRINTNDSSN
ncbi:MAG: YjjI family glycine radical enzyme [Erysipelotrichaceae bacterium]|nr:YjjI family glycine radical enzyme [Erysipelotrichaceae bacterium]